MFVSSLAIVTLLVSTEMVFCTLPENIKIALVLSKEIVINAHLSLQCPAGLMLIVDI